MNGSVTSSAGISYTFTAVAGRHVTLAITSPHVAPAGNRLQMNVYDSSGAFDTGGVLFSTSPNEIDFTPTAAQAGTTTVVISPYDSGTTGTFTLTYATDVTGVLTSGNPVTGTLRFGGQHTAYTFTAVAGRHVTLAITSPHVAPAGNRLQMNVYDSSGAFDTGGVLFSTSPNEIDFTPTAAQAGTTTVIISPYDSGTTGTFTLTYATDVTGVLTSGNPVTGTLRFGGQHTAYTFTAVAGRHVTLAITSPHVAPAGNRLQMNVYDSSGAFDTGGVLFSTSPNEIDFTPTAAQAGTTTVVISPYDFETTGTFTLTCTGCASPPVPVVTSLSPKSGPVGGGTLVIVTGAGFTGASEVLFGSVRGTAVTVLNDSTIAVLSPAEVAGTDQVTVKTDKGTSKAAAGDTYKVNYAVPVVTSLSPKSGPVGGGTLVVVTGSGFTGATKVSFGLVRGTAVTVLNDSTLKVLSPVQAAGTYNVTVTAPGGVSAPVAGDKFRVS